MATPLSDRSIASRLTGALLASAIAGVLVAGLAVPGVAGVGLLAKGQADRFLGLPAELNAGALSTRSTVLGADGTVLATFYRVNRVDTAFADIPDVTKKALIAIEDSRFYEHDGIDLKGSFRAALTNLTSGGVSQGGSTLTQQYVKNALIEAAYNDPKAQAAARSQTIDRKEQEARYALQLEKELTKDQILGRYFEIAYFGNGVYGIGTAANFYFKKAVKDLSLTESAELAGMVQNPSRFNPMSADPAVRASVKARRDVVLARMQQVGYLTATERVAAVAEPLPVVAPDKVPSNCDAPTVVGPFFCDYVRYELEDTPVGAALGKTKEERQTALFNAGLVIKTSLVPAIQKIAQDTVDKRVPRQAGDGGASVVDMVEPGTGKIKAMAVDRGFGDNVAAGQTRVNLATGGKGGFQPGSTAKIFTLTAALQQGIPVNTQIQSPAKYTSKVFFNGKKSVPYEPTNAGDSESGTFDLRTGTQFSVNTFFVQLAERTGLQAPFSLATRLGVEQKVLGGADIPVRTDIPANVLGAFDTSPLEMAGAYASYAAHGVFCPPRAVQSIMRADGTPLKVPDNPCTQVVDPGVADTVTNILQGVISGGTAARNGPIGRPAAGKTGTTNESRAAWFIGYTPQLATAVWVGKLDKAGASQPMQNTRVGGNYTGRQMYGGDLPTQIWSEVMRTTLTGIPVEQFAGADSSVVNGKPQTIPDVSGLSIDDATAKLEAAGFSVSPGKTVSSSVKKGRTAYTYPQAGANADAGATVYVYKSG